MDFSGKRRANYRFSNFMRDPRSHGIILIKSRNPAGLKKFGIPPTVPPKHRSAERAPKIFWAPERGAEQTLVEEHSFFASFLVHLSIHSQLAPSHNQIHLEFMFFNEIEILWFFDEILC